MLRWSCCFVGFNWHEKSCSGAFPPSLLWPLPLFPDWIRGFASRHLSTSLSILRHHSLLFRTRVSPNSGDHLIFAPFTCIKITLDCINGGKEIFSDPMQFPTQLLLVLNSTYPEFIGGTHLKFKSVWEGKDCKWPLQYSEVSRRFQSNLVWEEEEEKTKVATLQGLISPFPFLVLCPISMQTRQTANSSISLTPLSH